MVNDTMAGESRMERKKAGTRQKIMEAAMDLFNRQGFHDTTMEQIAEAADVARKTLYNYYPVKEAIADGYLRSISIGLAEECREEIRNMPDTRSRLMHSLVKVYHWVSLNPELSDITIRYRMQIAETDCDNYTGSTGTQIIAAEILRQGQLDGEIRNELTVDMMVKYLNLLRSSVFITWLKQPGEFSLEEKIGEVVDLFLFGVSTTVPLPARSARVDSVKNQERK